MLKSRSFRRELQWQLVNQRKRSCISCLTWTAKHAEQLHYLCELSFNDSENTTSIASLNCCFSLFDLQIVPNNVATSKDGRKCPSFSLGKGTILPSAWPDESEALENPFVCPSSDQNVRGRTEKLSWCHRQKSIMKRFWFDPAKRLHFFCRFNKLREQKHTDTPNFRKKNPGPQVKKRQWIWPEPEKRTIFGCVLCSQFGRVMPAILKSKRHRTQEHHIYLKLVWSVDKTRNAW